MSDLISREALLDEIKAMYCFNGAIMRLMQVVRAIPAVDAEPVRHSSWVEYPDRWHLKCSHCRVEFEKEKMPTVRNYCPNCGAKMDLEDD